MSKTIYWACHRAGGMTAYNWREDPKRLAFQFARYKFAAKMLQGKRRVLEVGCGDGVGARIMRQHVPVLVAVDVDARAIAQARRLASPRWPVEFRVHDIVAAPLHGFDAAYCLDLFEHIGAEERLLANLWDCAPVVLIGTPSLESQRYASAISRAGHVNCKNGEELRVILARRWAHVFLFSMNDEVVHTGFAPMAHYLLALCVA